MHKVGSLAQLKEGKSLCASIDDIQIAVFLVDGKAIATTNECPHAGGPLGEGTLCGATVSCPWHGWSFNLQTGQCDEDPDVVLPFYNVHIQDDEVFVTL